LFTALDGAKTILAANANAIDCRGNIASEGVIRFECTQGRERLHISVGDVPD